VIDGAATDHDVVLGGLGLRLRWGAVGRQRGESGNENGCCQTAHESPFPPNTPLKASTVVEGGNAAVQPNCHGPGIRAIQLHRAQLLKVRPVSPGWPAFAGHDSGNAGGRKKSPAACGREFLLCEIQPSQSWRIRASRVMVMATMEAPIKAMPSEV